MPATKKIKGYTMNISPSNSGCVIMASGLGRRFGGNKLMADFGGKPMIQWIIDATKNLFKELVVVTRNEEVRKLCENQNIPVIFHNLPHRSDTIKLGLSYFSNSIDGVMFCPSDQPFLSANTIKLILGNSSPDSIVRPVYKGTVGTPVWFSKSLFSELTKLPEGKGGNVVIKNYLDMVKDVEIQDFLEGFDIDNKTAWKALQNLTNNRGNIYDIKSIWSQYLESGKKHIVITGKIGIGKTTLYNELYSDIPGITTWAIRGESVRLKKNGTEENITIGVFDPTKVDTDQKMNPVMDGFEDATDIIRELCSSDDIWVGIDEIGYLDTMCPIYLFAINELLEKKNVIAVVRKQSLPVLRTQLNLDDAFVVNVEEIRKEDIQNQTCLILSQNY